LAKILFMADAILPASLVRVRRRRITRGLRGPGLWR
jgi:hypothetical protein